jgi:hypothetical protein
VPVSKNAVVLSPLYIDTIILPRQARAKHREQHSKRGLFSSGHAPRRLRALHAGLLPDGVRGEQLHRPQVRSAVREQYTCICIYTYIQIQMHMYTYIYIYV